MQNHTYRVTGMTCGHCEAAVRSEVGGIDGVDSVDVRGDSVLIHGSDSDAIARHLLNHTTARDLEITSRNLEEAFVALTGDDATIPSMTSPEGVPV